MDNSRDVDEIVTLFKAQGVAPIVDAIGEGGAAVTALQGVGEAVKTLYWKRKDLAGAVILAGAAIAAGLAVAGRETDSGLRTDILSVVKAIAYNMGSFTWPGWDEVGIVPGATDLASGLYAAQLNLRLAEQLGKGDLPLARGEWLVAAHLVCAGDLPAARGHFEQSEVYARRADSMAECHLARAFAGLVGASLAEGGDHGQAQSREQLRTALADLAGAENGDDFIRQVRTAAKVFGWQALLLETIGG